MADVIMVRLNGIVPLLMASPVISTNPLHPITKERKTITAKPPKQITDDDILRLKYLDFHALIYWTESTGPYIPAETIEANIRNGAGAERKGKTMQFSMYVEPSHIPLIYDGPRGIDELYELDEHVDVRNVGISSGRSNKKILRCRPRFNHWALEFTISYTPSLVDREAILRALANGGSRHAIGDFRPRYGRFEVIEIS